MNVREKLVELQLQADIADNISENGTQHREFIADLMIANGVTVQEWISVDDMLPENGKEDVLIALRWGEIDIGGYEDGRWRSEFVNEYEDGEVTNWMPLPQLPKGE